MPWLVSVFLSITIITIGYAVCVLIEILFKLMLSVLKAWVGLGQPGSARTTYYCYARRI